MNTPQFSKITEPGPFDIVGDVHGCFDELVELLVALGYEIEEHRCLSTAGRTVIFLGDLVDRGPKVTDVLKLAISMVNEGQAICVPGNHDLKLMRKLRGHDVKIAHGLKESLDQLSLEPQEFSDRVRDFFETQISHYVLDEGRLVVAHAGVREKDHGKNEERVMKFALYGETNGQTDSFGLPVRLDWAREYHGKPKVVYGHTPVYAPEWVNNTINVDTGCVFGGSLTALRYPEMQLASVKAHHCYCETQRPFMPMAEISPKLSVNS